MVWRRRLEDRSIAICWLGFRRATQNAQSFSPAVNGSMGVFLRAVSVMTMAGPISMDHTSLASCSSDVKARNSVYLKESGAGIKSFSQARDCRSACADRVPKRSTLFSMAIPTMPGPRIKGLPTFMVTPTPRKRGRMTAGYLLFW